MTNPTTRKFSRFDYALKAEALEILRQAPAGVILTMVEALDMALAARG